MLEKYAERGPITRPYFEAEPEAPVEAFEAAAARHILSFASVRRSCRCAGRLPFLVRELPGLSHL